MIYYLKGLPASGKTSWSIEKVRESRGSVRRISKDDMRLMFDAGTYSTKNEKRIVSVERDWAEDMVGSGYDVIIDNTGFNPSHESFYREMAKKYNVAFDVMLFDTDVEECIRRDLHRGDKAVGEQVIRRMWRQYVEPVQERHVGNGPKTAIFDIDGTIAIIE